MDTKNPTSYVKPPPPLDMRPRFITIWKERRFRSDTLAKLAKVPEETILRMFRDEAVERSVAEEVLAALSQLLGEDYSLETVKVKLL